MLAWLLWQLRFWPVAGGWVVIVVLCKQQSIGNTAIIRANLESYFLKIHMTVIMMLECHFKAFRYSVFACQLRL